MIQRALTVIFYPLSVLLLILFFIVLIIPISLVIWPFEWQTRLKYTAPFWRIFGICVINLVCICKSKTIDRRDPSIRKLNIPPGLYVANHQSFVDVPFLLSTFQVPPIMKKEILYAPIFGVCAYSAGTMVVDRKKNKSRRRTFVLAKERLTTYYSNLQYYPEGTRQKKDLPPRPIEKIKKPLIKFAYNNNISVYPVSIYGTRKVLNSIAMISYRTSIGKILHEAVVPSNYQSENDFCEAVWDKVCSGYLELEKELS